MISLTSKKSDASVLEPSSGEGAFLDALFEAGFRDVLGVEIDKDLAAHSNYPVSQESFISWNTDKRFDLIIGNPPYIRWKDLDRDQKEELTNNRLFGTLVNSLGDYLLPFIALSVEKLEQNGELIFITPSFWLQTKHARPLRDFLDQNGTITDFVDFGETQIFKNVATSLVIFKFVKTTQPKTTYLHRFVGDKVQAGLDLRDKSQFTSQQISNPRTKGKYVLAFDHELEVPLELELACAKQEYLFGEVIYRTLGQYVRIANGMVTGLDSAFRLSREFVEKLDPGEISGVSKVSKGKNLQHLFSPDFTYYIDIPSEIEPDEAVTKFPTLLRHLSRYKPELEKRYDYGAGAPWYHWSFYRSENFHRSPSKKGFVPGKERLTHRKKVRFSLGAPGSVPTQDVTAFAPLEGTKESIEYIVAYLSRFSVSQWIRAFGLMKGGVAEFSEKPLSEIPFRSIDWANEAEVRAHDQIRAVMIGLEKGFESHLEAEVKLQNLFTELLPRSLSI